MIDEKRWRHLYEAATWMKLDTVEGRTLEQWIDRVGDFGLDDAHWALSTFIETRYAQLTRVVSQAAKDYRLASRIFLEESDRLLFNREVFFTDPEGVERKINDLLRIHGDEMRAKGKILDEKVDALMAFEAEYDIDKVLDNFPQHANMEV